MFGVNELSCSMAWCATFFFCPEKTGNEGTDQVVEMTFISECHQMATYMDSFLAIASVQGYQLQRCANRYRNYAVTEHEGKLLQTNPLRNILNIFKDTEIFVLCFTVLVLVC